MWYLLEIVIFTVLLIFDLSSKEAVVVFLKQKPFNYYDLIDGVLALNYSENTGAGWGMFKDHTEALIVITAICMAAVLAYLIICPRTKKLIRLPLVLILAGGLGNLVDRIALGYVRDFIQFTFMDFPIFNLADNFLTIGTAWLIIVLVVEIFVEFKKEKGAGSGRLKISDNVIDERVGAVYTPQLKLADFFKGFALELKWDFRHEQNTTKILGEDEKPSDVEDIKIADDIEIEVKKDVLDDAVDKENTISSLTDNDSSGNSDLTDGENAIGDLPSCGANAKSEKTNAETENTNKKKR